jgi:hypothetical protein
VALVRDFVNVQVALAPEQAVVRARPDGVSSLQARVAQVNALSLRAGARHQRERLGETDS